MPPLAKPKPPKKTTHNQPDLFQETLALVPVPSVPNLELAPVAHSLTRRALVTGIWIGGCVAGGIVIGLAITPQITVPTSPSIRDSTALTVKPTMSDPSVLQPAKAPALLQGAIGTAAIIR